MKTDPGQHDVVVVGAGVAGMVGAIAAARAGLSVVLIEKTSRIGGAAGWAYGAIWVPGSDQSIAAGVVDDPQGLASYLMFITGGENDPARTQALVQQAPAMLRLLDEVGVRVEYLPGVGDLLMGKTPGAVAEGRTHQPVPIGGAVLGGWRDRLVTPTGDAWRLPISELTSLRPDEIAPAIVAAITADQLAQGPALVAQLMIALRDHGVSVMFDTQVVRLLKRDGAVVGVETGTGAIIAARCAVLLSSGAYLSNEALVASLDSLPGYRSQMPAGSDGDGLKAAAEIGAAVAIIRNNLALNVGYDDPAHPGAPLHPASVWELPRAHMIMVNADGQRFGNEATFQEYSPALRAYDPKTRRMRNLPCWMIFDATYADRWGFAGAPPGSVPDWVMRADSIAGLATMAGIDPAGLAATVDRFAGFAAKGIDEDFGRVPGWDRQQGGGEGPNPSLGAIRKPPYYAVKLSPSLQVGGSGIRADAGARALDWSGTPIPGLYVSGDVALHDDFGTGYQAGLSLVSAMTFATIAIADAASR